MWRLICIALALLAMTAQVSARKDHPSRHSGKNSPVTISAPSFALVIGNGNYAHLPMLRNPINDARAIEQTLRHLDFEVIRLEDATKVQMEAGLRQLASRLNSDAVALVYFAGHGVQIAEHNYLIPVDAAVSNATALGSVDSYRNQRMIAARVMTAR